MWFLLMLVILLTNGMSAFGLKVIAAWGLPELTRFPYLAAWYAAGLISIGVPMALLKIRPGLKEVAWGSVLAVLSMGGQLAMAMSLERGVPGHVVFPVSIGGSIFVVALAGRLFFGERMNRTSMVGVLCGLSAVILLGMT